MSHHSVSQPPQPKPVSGNTSNSSADNSSNSSGANNGVTPGGRRVSQVGSGAKSVRNVIHSVSNALSNLGVTRGTPQSPRQPNTPRDSQQPDSARSTLSDRSSHSSSDLDDADAEMSHLFNVLRDDKAAPDQKSKHLQEGIARFLKALQPQASAEADSEGFPGDLYAGRLKERLEKQPQQKLQQLSLATKHALSELPNMVLGQLDLALENELARRRDVMRTAEQDLSKVLNFLAEGQPINTWSAETLEQATSSLASLKAPGMEADDRMRHQLGQMPPEKLMAIGRAASDVLDQREEPVIRQLLVLVGEVLSATMSAPVKAVDAQMNKVLDALASGDASKIPSSVQAFQKTAVQEASSSQREVFSIGAYRDRLQWRLQTMPWNTLVDVSNTAASYGGTDPTLDFMAFAALAEFVRRVTRDVPRQGAAQVLSQLSRQHLNDLALKASRLVKTAPAMAPNAPLAQRMPGTSLTTEFLLQIVDEAGTQLAIKIVEEDARKSIAAMTAFEREELTWAMGVWRELGLVVKAPPPNWEQSAATHRDLSVYNMFRRMERDIEMARSGSAPSTVTTPTAPVAEVPATQTVVAQPPQHNRTRSTAIHLGHVRASSLVPPSPRRGADRSTVEGEATTPRGTQSRDNDAVKTAIQAADASMTLVFENLLSPAVNVGSIRMSCDAFIQAMAPLNGNSSNSAGLAEKQYSSRLKMRFERMPSDAVERLAQSATNLLKLEKIGVVQGIEQVAKAESKRRAAVLKSAEPVMKDVLKALIKGKDLGPFGNLDVAERVEKFIETMKPINTSPDKNESVAIAMFKDRLNAQLIKLSLAELKALDEGVSKSNLTDVVVDAIGVAVKAQLQMRAAAKVQTSGQSS